MPDTHTIEPKAARLPSASRIFLNSRRQLRNGWWIAAFFALLAALLFPAILISARMERPVSIWEQVLLIAVATTAIQALRRKPLTEVTGRPDLRALRGLVVGLGLGFLLMAIPAAVLWFAGAVRFHAGSADLSALLGGVVLMGGVAIAEELLFRGVLFQRLVAGVGVWPAQIAVGLLFVLTHLGNPGMDGEAQLMAGANIFIASLLFGLTFLRGGGLAMPIGLHFMANVTQGLLLGFGVSGNTDPGLLTPEFVSEARWLTGGAFGLEASLPGLVTLAVMVAWFALRRREG